MNKHPGKTKYTIKDLWLNKIFNHQEQKDFYNSQENAAFQMHQGRWEAIIFYHLTGWHIAEAFANYKRQEQHFLALCFWSKSLLRFFLISVFSLLIYMNFLGTFQGAAIDLYRFLWPVT